MPPAKTLFGPSGTWDEICVPAANAAGTMRDADGAAPCTLGS